MRAPIRLKVLLSLWLLLTSIIAITAYWNYHNTRTQLIELFNNPAVIENTQVREMLIENVALAETLPMACLYIVLLILVWLILRWYFRPLERINQAIALRQPDFLAPISPERIPAEIKPMVNQINHLLDRLKEALTREKHFTADAAHELRTPLAALKAQAQVALTATEADTQRRALEKVIIGVDRSTHVMQQLALLAQIKPNEPLKDITDLNLLELAREVIAELVPTAIEKDIEFELKTDIEKPIILGSPMALQIMLRNIIDNAIRYSPSHSEIIVKIFRSADQIVLRVQDQGPGIPPELHERIFERFYRGEGHQVSGSGLGLAIVDQIATLHKASLRLSKPESATGLYFDVMFKITPSPT